MVEQLLQRLLAGTQAQQQVRVPATGNFDLVRGGGVGGPDQ